MSELIVLEPGPGGLAEDKDLARSIRQNQILPAIESGERVVLDFSSIPYATQSFVHALFAEVLQKHGEKALDQLEFRGCSEAMRSLIELVVDYTLGGFPERAAS